MSCVPRDRNDQRIALFYYLLEANKLIDAITMSELEPTGAETRVGYEPEGSSFVEQKFIHLKNILVYLFDSFMLLRGTNLINKIINNSSLLVFL